MANTDNLPLLMFIVLVPLFGAASVYLAGGGKFSGWLATGWAVVSFQISLLCFLMVGNDPDSVLRFRLENWFSAGDISAAYGFRLDALSSVMTLVVTGVGSLIHLYAIGYMADDEDRVRFFAYLNLFLFAMLTLVLADNLVLMFVGWEGVGLCSYLLIGFWYRKMPNAIAGQKAFVVNRIGDAGFLLGMFTLFLSAGTVEFDSLASAVPNLDPVLVQAAAALLFIGAIGKSAQIPLYVWLPDAMAGPTPVSALIHAATMVTAGVYMVARLGFLYIVSPHVLCIILIIGTLTALLAATIALVQTDIKRVLAYSTVSQLGFMFMAAGAGAFSNGIYHVVTHAFFKACLFMAAGSVIVGCHHEQDMRKFGGLWKRMPLTFAAYLLATLAIAGVPTFSGAYSKDAILYSVYTSAEAMQGVALLGIPIGAPFGMPISRIAWASGIFTAMLTAFYMTRSLVLTFFGSYRGHGEPHESPLVMTVPVAILGFLSWVFAVMHGETLMRMLVPWTRSDLDYVLMKGEHLYHELEYFVIGAGSIGIIAALGFYLGAPWLADRTAKTFAPLYRALKNKWWVDELYDAVIIRPLQAAAAFLFAVVDSVIVDGTVNGSAAFVQVNSQAVRRLHTGRVAHVLLWMFAGVIVILGIWLA